jgi:hypothetical protein
MNPKTLKQKVLQTFSKFQILENVGIKSLSADFWGKSAKNRGNSMDLFESDTCIRYCLPPKPAGNLSKNQENRQAIPFVQNYDSPSGYGPFLDSQRSNLSFD